KQKVDVPAGGEKRLQVQLADEAGGDLAGGGGGGGGSIWPWVVVGAGALAIGGGVYTGISAQSLYDQLDTKRKNDELIAASDIDVGNNLVLTTNVLLGVGSAAVIGGVAWWLLGDSGVETEGSLSGGFGVTPGGASVGLSGSF
ncbi:MAG: hypothetical protein KC549_16535, partial [Myxococcales bacterium]|nr:hypothetical protein [Myxococcales bacterium]